MSASENCEIKECMTLSSYYFKPSCQGKLCGNIPSYYKENKGIGCLIAHTLLALCEYNEIRKRALSIVSKMLIRAIKRRGINIRHDITSSLEEFLDLSLALAILLHDLGKTSPQYRKAKTFRHEALSSIYVYHLLREVEEKFAPTKEDIKMLKIPSQLASAVLLHHESYYWRELEESITMIDITQVINRKLTSYVPLREHNCSNFINALIQNLREHKLLPEKAISYLETFSKIINKVYVNNLRHEVIMQIRDCRNITYNNLVLPLYYIIFLVDNRAASARRKYWKETYSESIHEVKTRNYEALMREIFKIGGTYTLHVTLTLLPLDHIL